MKPRSQLSTVTLVIGVLLTLAASLVTYHWPQSSDVSFALVVGLIGIAITVALDSRVKARDIEDAINESLAENAAALQIRENSLKDEHFWRRYEEIRKEVSELASGIYRIPTLIDVYHDDIRSISGLKPGERLYSMCPVSNISRDDAWKQLSDAYYKSSMDAHISGAQQGVRITRLYLFKDRNIFDDQRIKNHLLDLSRAGLDLRIIFRDEVAVNPDKLDFIVFGETKVSVGGILPDSSTVKDARAYISDSIVKEYAREFEKMARVGLSPKQLGLIS